MISIPILRAGNPYISIDKTILRHFSTGEPVAEVSQANPGLIARDLNAASDYKKELDRLKISELLQICRKAADYFANSTLPVGDHRQSPEEYVRQISATTGMPQSLCTRNMEKIRFVLENMEEVIHGLTRGIPFEILDRGFGTQDQRALSYFCATNIMGAILPNNSPGVHALWLAALPLKVPVALKPGGQEPWTPFRIAQAFIAAGCPPSAFSFYPTNYSGASEILLRAGRSMFFGDASTVKAWKNDPRVQIHGPGWSKLILGNDAAADWQKYIDVMAISISENGGRSCLNASGIWVPSNGREIAEALALKLSEIQARPADDPVAVLAAFANKKFAERISAMIDTQLEIPGAEDISAKYRKGPRLVELNNAAYLLPTIIYCTDPDHPLAQSEFLFPFASVVEVPVNSMLAKIGPTLVVTAISNDPQFTSNFLASQQIERLNLGVIPTSRISWNQPHEGNLFEHLYKQRAFQSKLAPVFAPEVRATS